MNVIDQLNVERQARGTAQSARDEKRQAIVSKQETLGVQALGLADEIARQVPILAQAVTWAGGGWTLGCPVVRAREITHLDAILAARKPNAAPNDPAPITGCAPEPALQTVLLDPFAFVEASSFLTHIAHEIATPITGLIGLADLLCDTPLTAEQRVFADTIKSTATAALALSHDILDYAKIKAHGLSLLAQPFDLERLIQDIATLMQPVARAKALHLLVDFDPHLPRQFIGDPIRLRQVLTNLVGNAVKFTKWGHVKISVVGLEAGAGVQQVHITVEDTGIGITPSDLGAIFDAFHQATPNAGLGLGLTLAKQLIVQMGGAIWVDSEAGQGSSFGIRVPLPVADAPVMQPDTSRPPQEAGPPRPMRILAAEDNRTNQLVFQKMVRDLEIDVVFANTGGEAVDLFQSFKPDLIFMDIAMPQMNGCQATQAIRQMEAGRSRLPIIALTARSAEEDHTPLLAAGIDRYMTKPLHKAALHAVLTEFCPKTAYIMSPAIKLGGVGT